MVCSLSLSLPLTLVRFLALVASRDPIGARRCRGRPEAHTAAAVRRALRRAAGRCRLATIVVLAAAAAAAAALIIAAATASAEARRAVLEHLVPLASADRGDSAQVLRQP